LSKVATYNIMKAEQLSMSIASSMHKLIIQDNKGEKNNGTI